MPTLEEKLKRGHLLLPKQKKAGGRPRKQAEELRIHTITISVTEAEYRTLKEQAGHVEPPASKKGSRPMPTRARSIAGMVRDRLFKSEGTGRGQGPTIAEQQALLAVAGEARNINQLAKLAHAQGFETQAQLCEIALRKLYQLLDRYDR
jgi:hypothetical protein